MSEIISRTDLIVRNGRPVTSSLKVAEYFGKLHKNVVRDIENLIAKRPELRELNFELTRKINKIGAVTRETPFYWMDRKGFCILAMGFTGAKALDFKCAFYDEFERMERELHPTIDSLPESVYLADEHAYAIMTAVAQRAKNIGAHYQTIYRALKARYQVPKYSHIRDADFEDAMRFIQTLDLSVPEASPTHDHVFDETGRCRVCGLRPLPSDCAVFQPRQMQRLLMWVYTWRYLHRASLRRFDKLLHDMGSPFSASFHEAVIDPWMGTLEDILREHGYDVRSLPCYQYFATHGGEV